MFFVLTMKTPLYHILSIHHIQQSHKFETIYTQFFSHLATNGKRSILQILDKLIAKLFNPFGAKFLYILRSRLFPPPVLKRFKSLSSFLLAQNHCHWKLSPYRNISSTNTTWKKNVHILVLKMMSCSCKNSWTVSDLLMLSSCSIIEDFRDKKARFQMIWTSVVVKLRPRNSKEILHNLHKVVIP